MKNIILIILTLIVNLTYAQTEKEKNKIVTEKFVENYNSNNYDTIFSMFSAKMKDYFPKEKNKEFLNGLKSQLGNITNQEFIKYENETVASYKSTFEKGVWVLNISINNNSEINGFSVKPFAEEINSKNVINNLTIKDGLITKKQSEIIFENSKIFPKQTQISIAIIKNRNVRFYGIKINDDTISTIDNHKSIFEIGSITKVFTSTLLANYVIEGKIKLNDNINDYLRIPFNNASKVSFINLANHTSGLPKLPTNLDLTKVNPENPYKEYKEKELKEYLTKHLELSNKGKYQYSNLGAGLLGYTLSKIEKDTYERLLQNKIFSKYNMLNSTSNLNKAKGKITKGLYASGNEVSNWEFSALAGAGGVLSTVEDMAKFAITQFDCSNKELKLTRKKTFKINDSMSIGLGWHIIKLKSGSVLNWHNGGTGGYSSSMAIDMKNKNGIIILSNVSTFNPKMGNIEKLCFELMETLINK